MFSSAQIEYIRYWIVEQGIASEKEIQIPNSSYLLKENIELRAVSPQVFTTAEALKNANKVRLFAVNIP